mmetsp:Transcript_1890/g.6775  ORF Transcript_1890/g.6775 Transcript_1890/m.6775 type:complete len:115 (+) Transcript_1890:149-493(+)
MGLLRRARAACTLLRGYAPAAIAYSSSATTQTGQGSQWGRMLLVGRNLVRGHATSANAAAERSVSGVELSKAYDNLTDARGSEDVRCSVLLWCVGLDRGACTVARAELHKHAGA